MVLTARLTFIQEGNSILEHFKPVETVLIIQSDYEPYSPYSLSLTQTLMLCKNYLTGLFL